MTSSADVLALFAKAPVPGQVKTRLCPPLHPEEAAALYEAMLLDIVGLHAEPDHACGAERALWVAPAEALPWFRDRVPASYVLRAQQGPDLSARMRALFHHHADAGARRMVLRGTDSPTLPLARIDEAFAALESADLVLCPDRDGGYNLIGLCKPADPLFDLEMSTGSVLDTTLRRADELGMRAVLLEAHHDVDTHADLVRLDQARRAGELDPSLTPRTQRWLEAHPQHASEGTR